MLPELTQICGAPMAQQIIPAPKTDSDFERLLTPKETAEFLRVSESWLAKARMRGDGPPYLLFGRSIRYGGGGLVRWMKSCVRQSTSER
jgi:predicted DNA-binding transcriptional regulator AlpA